MRIRVESKISGDFDALVVGSFSDQQPNLAGLDDKTIELVKRVKDVGGASKLMETETVLYGEGGPAKRLTVIGMGKAADLDVMAARRVAGAAARALRKKGAKKLAFALPFGELDPNVAAQAFAEGVALSVFETTAYRTGENKEEKVLDDVLFVTAQDVKDAVQRGAVIGEGANYARYLANEPANVMTPTRLAEEAQKTAQQFGLEFDVLDVPRLQEGGFKAILAVGMGSVNEPRMIVMKYNGGGEGQPYFGLVGKGLTFDSGGISIKPAEGMGDMKMDMSGGAWVIGTMRILAQLKPKINVLGVVGAAENMPSGTAYRPGDIVETYEGKTIEVLNTDAEGRVVLADALAYARKLGANKLVDLATLTGAVVVALGTATTGVFGTNKEFTDLFLKTAKEAGERAWELPLFPEYREQITSSVGDILNTGGRAAGSITAAAFLKEFTGDLPWIHLDIAGTAWTEAEKPYLAKGSSGQIIRTLVDFVFAQQ